jgi:hypothetical protein
MISDEEIIFIIEESVSRNTVPQWSFYSGVKTKLFRYKSLLRWAADELENYILKHHGDHYDEILMGFREKMLKYYFRSDKQREAFIIAYNFAGDVNDILSAAGWI